MNWEVDIIQVETKYHLGFRGEEVVKVIDTLKFETKTQAQEWIDRAKNTIKFSGSSLLKMSEPKEIK